jgi:hypothetical protein
VTFRLNSPDESEVKAAGKPQSKLFDEVQRLGKKL